MTDNARTLYSFNSLSVLPLLSCILMIYNFESPEDIAIVFCRIKVHFSLFQIYPSFLPACSYFLPGLTCWRTLYRISFYVVCWPCFSKLSVNIFILPSQLEDFFSPWSSIWDWQLFSFSTLKDAVCCFPPYNVSTKKFTVCMNVVPLKVKYLFSSDCF